jgi:hypothetical protein
MPCGHQVVTAFGDAVAIAPIETALPRSLWFGVE